jgi:beta-lactamase regulating signal transducer with metallopeptidase domain
MIDAMIKSSVIIAVAAVSSVLFSRQSASLRHMIWTAGLVFALIAPLSAPLLPSWQVELVPSAVSIIEAPQFTALDVIVVSAAATFSWSNFIFLVWLAGIGVAGVWLLAGASRLAWVAFHAKPVRARNWIRLTADISRSLHLRRPVRLLQTDRSQMMGAWGIFCGRVLLPRDAESWPDERIRVVLIHELAHIKRNDWVIQFMRNARESSTGSIRCSG